MAAIVLGIDPGLSISGFAIIERRGQCAYLLECGYLSLPASKSIAERISLFHDFFIQKISYFRVTSVALETPFLGKNSQSFLKLGYLRGIVYLIGNKAGIVVHDFSPREVKQMVTGHGGASKEQIAHVIAQFFPAIQNVKKIKADVTDACAIALCGYWYQNRNPVFLK